MAKTAPFLRILKKKILEYLHQTNPIKSIEISTNLLITMAANKCPPHLKDSSPPETQEAKVLGLKGSDPPIPITIAQMQLFLLKKMKMSNPISLLEKEWNLLNRTSTVTITEYRFPWLSRNSNVFIKGKKAKTLI